MSKAPQSKVPESKAPRSEVPESKAPRSEAPKSSYAQSQVPGTRLMPTNCDRVESKDSQSKAPQSKTPRSEAPKSSYAQSRTPETRLMPSNADRVESKAPESKYPQSRAAGTRLMPSHADRQASKAPQSKVPQSKVPESKAPRPEAPKSNYAPSRTPGTRLMPSHADRQASKASYSRGPGTKPSYNDDDDDEYDDEPEPKSAASKQPKSFLFTPKDHNMAERQSRYGTLTPKQQEENDAWANEMFKAGNTCPEGTNWIRSKGRASWFGHGAYYCVGEGHVATDPLVSEAMGAMYATIGDESGKLDRIVGPFYPHPDRPNEGCYAEDMVLKGYTVRMEEWIKPPADEAEKKRMIHKMTR